ncbi:WYL domain-containing protein [Microbacterium sp. HD4P20]|uniref:helix-turn-helix transcriptional regulator n=1 Tax=Microbacterium sp. HD4P20 TaxID=2864874 RepID=UPI0027E33B2F|nr:WYL domain-containing protein [Microbacterium sp. HD4P20]
MRRDVDRLRELGYRVEATKGPDGGYRLEAGSELPPLLFDDEQAVAVTVALRAAALSSAGIEEAALRALATVRQVMPARLRHRYDAIDFTAAAEDREPVDAAVLEAISAGIRAREELRFDYVRVGGGIDSASEEVTAPRRTQPHHLVAMSGRWYVVGWDAEREDWRVYRVDRMRLRSHRGARFASRTVPGGDPHGFLRARFRGTTDADAWPCRATVVVHASAARVLPFASDGVVTPIDADTCLLETGAWSWPALAALLARFDTEIDVVEPPELSKAFADLAARARRTAAGASVIDSPSARNRRGADSVDATGAPR